MLIFLSRATNHAAIFPMFDEILVHLSERLNFLPNLVWRHELWKKIKLITADLRQYTSDSLFRKALPFYKKIKRWNFLGFFCKCFSKKKNRRFQNIKYVRVKVKTNMLLSRNCALFVILTSIFLKFRLRCWNWSKYYKLK